MENTAHISTSGVHAGLPADKHVRRAARSRSLLRPELLRPAVTRALVMLLPWVQARNPVMFVVEVGDLVRSSSSMTSSPAARRPT